MNINAFKIICSSLVLTLFATLSLAQQDAFKVGDKVEAEYYADSKYRPATIIEIDHTGKYKAPYVVIFDDKSLATTRDSLPASKIRARGKFVGAFKVGDRVDHLEGKNARGTIVAVSGHDFKVHYDGCKPHWDQVVDGARLHPAATLSASDPAIRFLTGNWAMFTPSYPNTVIRGNNIYREYGMGGKAPPLQIKADGTYVWYFDFGKPPIKGQWVTHPKVEGATTGTEKWDGLVIKDPTGQEWKVYKWVKPDKSEGIVAHQMCSGMTMTGSRIK